jgi:hypothetical protein
MLGADGYIGAQVQTMVVLLGVLFGVVIWGFFQRRPTK